MCLKRLFLLLGLICFFNNVFSQHIDEGFYNDWDYGPNGVYGNLGLTKIKYREYYKIEKMDSHTVNVQHFNPSGVLTHTTSVIFSNGILSKVEEKNQWGEIYDHKKFLQQIDKNEFIVTDLLRGENNYLPCKYVKYIYKDELLIETRGYSFTGSPNTS